MTKDDVLKLNPELDAVEAWQIAEAVNERLQQIAEMRLAEVMAGPYQDYRDREV